MKISRQSSLLLIVDMQAKLMPAIERGSDVIANVKKLCAAANSLGVPSVVTEQNPEGLGKTVGGLGCETAEVVCKSTFDATEADGFSRAVPQGREIVVAGCEAHVCVTQTSLGLIEKGYPIFLVVDAIGSRRGASRDVAVGRLAAAGVQTVTTEMVLFEWMGSSRHKEFKKILQLVR